MDNLHTKKWLIIGHHMVRDPIWGSRCVVFGIANSIKIQCHSSGSECILVSKFLKMQKKNFLKG